MLTLANAWGWIVLHKRLVGIAVSCFAGLVLLWYLFTQVQSCRTDRAIKKDLRAVNAATKEVANAQIVVIQAQANVNAAVEKVKEATNAVVVATQASEAGQRDVNTAVQNLANAVAANRPVDVNAADLERRLNDLGVQ